MVTGLEDQTTAAQAVNDGQVFRFLTKAASAAEILDALDAAIEHFRDQRSERLVLESTLVGAVQVLMDILALAQPAAAGCTHRIREVAGELARGLALPTWQVQLAVSLSQLGCVTLPPTMVLRVVEGHGVSSTSSDSSTHIPGWEVNLSLRSPGLAP